MANFTTRKSTKFNSKTEYANVAQSAVHRLGKIKKWQILPLENQQNLTQKLNMLM